MRMMQTLLVGAATALSLWETRADVGFTFTGCLLALAWCRMRWVSAGGFR